MKKGFTLIEVLAVIIILGIIALIVVPLVNDSIQSSREKVRNNQIETIERAAEQWALLNDNVIVNHGGEYILLFEELIGLGLLKNETIIDPTTNEPFEGYIYISWEEDYNQYYVSYVDADPTGCPPPC
ncbi:MAG: prepilin-type N-terminal cleavage/methylation domain-containing protein [Bacilli bacterium]|nr:prepilin-type N-terminal cleavage/methylation domain-containing protein [Bacilli bacterium]MDD4808564.1 prepilin-type N-terminal cleavage/methylation domain-containing protein [Bacilli bacterium]